MSKLERCRNCRGIGVIMGLGCIESKCSVCKGLQWVESQDKTHEDAVDALLATTPTEKEAPKKSKKVKDNG
jgi:DnaJ-class molecular chaperone